jgi:hypothetical protein
MSEEIKPTTQEMLKRMQDGWNNFLAYLKTLSDEQMTKPVDDVGWTVKDHVVHLAAWEDGIAALLAGQSRRERMNVDQGTWNTDNFDKINAVIQAKHKSKPVTDVLKMFQDAHQRMVEGVRKLSDQDLVRPYRSFDSNSTSESPIFASIVGNSYGHYEEHKPWIEAIVARSR